MEKAVSKSWAIQDVSAKNGYINVKRTLVRGLLFPSRSKGEIIVTYSRPVCPHPKCGKPVIDHVHKLENGETWHAKCWDQAQEELRKQQQKDADKQARKDNSKGLFGLIK